MITTKKFWIELKTAYGSEDVEKMFTMPKRCWKDEAIYKIKTKKDFIFDDAFWNVFHKYSFHICHISWKEHELRFIVKEEQ